MLHWLRELDQILRGERTRPEQLSSSNLEIPLLGIAALIVLLGALTGACMGTFALLRETGPEWRQVVASALKVPALFLLTLLITFPSLYVFNALVGSRLRFVNVLKLLIAGLGVTLAMLAAWGPIVAFFSVSTESYSFMILLNVAVFTVAGLLGLKFVLQTLRRMSRIEEDDLLRARAAAHALTPPEPPATSLPPMPSGTSAPASAPGPLDPLDQKLLSGHVRTVFRLWVLIFGLVGAQMSWVLRPFIGDPARPFQWFRPRQSNFFEAVWNTLLSLFSA